MSESKLKPLKSNPTQQVEEAHKDKSVFKAWIVYKENTSEYPGDGDGRANVYSQDGQGEREAFSPDMSKEDLRKTVGYTLLRGHIDKLAAQGKLKRARIFLNLIVPGMPQFEPEIVPNPNYKPRL